MAKVAGQKGPVNATAKVNFGKAANNTRRATGSGAKPFWYLEREDELSVVTNEPFNKALGISLIKVFEPTQAQKLAGILCKVKLSTLSATIDNISVFESRFAEGDIYMQMGGGRNVGTEEAPKWVRDCKLTAPAKAQVLSYVFSLLEPVKEQD